MIAKAIEGKECRHFEIPDAEVKYKRTWFPFSFNGFSEPYPLLNLSKGGLAFECQNKLAYGTKIKLQLLVPGHDPLDLLARVRWCRHGATEMTVTVVVDFQPFGLSRGQNSPEVLKVLGRLEQEHGEDEVKDEFNPLRAHLF